MRFVHHKAACLAFMSILSAVSSSANAEANWYLSGQLAGVGVNSTDSEERRQEQSCDPLGCTVVVGEDRYRSGFDGDRTFIVAAGVQASETFRVEVEYSSRSHETVTVTGANEDLDVKLLVLGAYRDFPIFSRALSPYVGAGFGLGVMEQGNLDDEFISLQLAAGLAWHLDERVSLDLSYRYILGEPDLVLEGGNREISRDYQSDSLGLGVRVYF